MKGRETNARSPRPLTLGIVAVLGAILAVGAALGLTVGFAVSHASAVCPKCLQQASITEKTVFGVRFYRKMTLLKGQDGLAPSTISGADLYRQITGHACDHEYIKTWIGRTSGRWFFRICADGGSTKWRLVQPWVAAREALYGAFARTGDRQSAVAVHAIIAGSYADLERSDLMRAAAVFVADAGDAAEDEILTDLDATFQHDADMNNMARRILSLRRLAARLQKVETVEDFQAICRELAPAPEGAGR